MKTKTISLTTLLLATMVLGGCAMNKTQEYTVGGAAVGAGAGALIGAASGNAGTGAAIGAAVGAVGGAMISD